MKFLFLFKTTVGIAFQISMKYIILQKLLITNYNVMRIGKYIFYIRHDRLIARRFFYLAIKICNYMKIPKADGVSRVLAHWACYKVDELFHNDMYLLRNHRLFGINRDNKITLSVTPETNTISYACVWFSH